MDYATVEMVERLGVSTVHRILQVMADYQKVLSINRYIRRIETLKSSSKYIQGIGAYIPRINRVIDDQLWHEGGRYGKISIYEKKQHMRVKQQIMGGKNMCVHDHTYKGWRSVVAENERVRVEMVPELGGKLVSLLYKPTEKEWLLDSGSRPLQPPVYGSVFTDGDMSGWDECFPTIEACRAGVGGDILLPDHGEVWSMPWSCEITDNQVKCSVEGNALPYRLTRTLTLDEGGRVRLAYEADNIGHVPMSFLWAAHPQFRVNEPTRIVTPDDMTELECVFGGLHRTVGATYPLADIVSAEPALTGDGTKFYYPGTVSQGWSGLLGMNSDSYLLLVVDPREVPHWGVWIDRGMCNDRVAIALEPGIGYYDSLARAAGNGTAPVIQPGQSYRWEVVIVPGHGDWTGALSS